MGLFLRCEDGIIQLYCKKKLFRTSVARPGATSTPARAVIGGGQGRAHRVGDDGFSGRRRRRLPVRSIFGAACSFLLEAKVVRAGDAAPTCSASNEPRDPASDGERVNWRRTPATCAVGRRETTAPPT